MVKLHKSQSEKIIAGVCGGLSESFKIPVSFIRASFIISILFGGMGIFVYLVLMMILPKFDEQIIDAEIIEDDEIDDEGKPFKRIHRSNDNRMIAGVCGGLANYLRVDVSLIRLIFVAMSFAGGIGTILYFVFWIMFPLDGISYE